MRETFDITANKMDKKSYDLTEAIDLVLGDESEVEELLSDSEEDILDFIPANASEENLSLQELVKKKEEKKDDTGTDNEKDHDENPTETHAAPTVPIYKWRTKDI